MSIVQVFKTRVLFLFRFFVAILRRVFCCKRKKSIGELPYTISDRNPQSYQGRGEDQWEGWSSTPFASSVEEKIEEYRRKKAEPETTVEKGPESDFFNDMQPKVVQARRAYIDSNGTDKQTQKSSLFALKSDEVPLYSSELGTLEDPSEDDEAEVWDTHIDIEGIDSVLREQRAKERQERRLARQVEHAKRLGQRKK